MVRSVLAVLGSLRGRVLRWAGFGGGLLFSLTVEVNLWNLVIISESINNSLTAAFVGVVLLYLRALDPGGGAPSPAPPAARWGWPLLVLLVGGLWILFSDKIIVSMFSDPVAITRQQTYKGWFYVGVTGLLFFFFLRFFFTLFFFFSCGRSSIGWSFRARLDDGC